MFDRRKAYVKIYESRTGREDNVRKGIKLYTLKFKLHRDYSMLENEVMSWRILTNFL